MMRRRTSALSVCYILSYYIPDYMRSRTLVGALSRIDHLTLYQARNSSKGFLRYFQTLWKLIAVRLLHHPEIYILGFRGYELFWLVRLLTIGSPLVLDHMMSPYDSLVNERKKITKGGLLAKVIYAYEKSILRSTNAVLTDTDDHQEYFHELFGISSSKIFAVPVGADEDLFHARRATKISRKFRPYVVLFYGSFLPLHGVDIILEAARLLREYPIHFTLIGGYAVNLAGFDRTLSQLDLKNVAHSDWVDLQDLPDRIAQADVGLGGPFGNTGQARRVITAKTFQLLAMGKPAIVGSLRPDYGFVDRLNCLMVPQGDPQALAEAIAWAFDHRAEMAHIGRRGYQLYQARYSTKRLSASLKAILFHET